MENTGNSKRISTKVKGTIVTPQGVEYLVVDTDKHRVVVPKIGAPETLTGILGVLNR